MFCCGGCDVHEPAGSGFREELALQWGYSLTTGGRAYMEDYHTAESKDTAQGEPVGLFAVYDGHGGRACVRYVRQKLMPAILQAPHMARSDVPGAMRAAFLEVDQGYLDKAGIKKTCGTTATVALLQKSRLFIAHVGDSRAVLVTQAGPVALTRDHKPDDPVEAQRIRDLGGTITCDDISRVEGVLAVTRAFGNNGMKKVIAAEPELREHLLTPKDQFLVIASDGVWDLLSNQAAANIVRRAPDCLSAAEALTTEAYRLGSMDNISAVVVALNFSGPLSISQRASSYARTLSQRGVRPPRPPQQQPHAPSVQPHGVTVALSPGEFGHGAHNSGAHDGQNGAHQQAYDRDSSSGYVSSDVAATAGTSAHPSRAPSQSRLDSHSQEVGSTLAQSSTPLWSGNIAPQNQAHPHQHPDSQNARAQALPAPHLHQSAPQAAPYAAGIARMSPVPEGSERSHRVFASIREVGSKDHRPSAASMPIAHGQLPAQNSVSCAHPKQGGGATAPLPRR